MVDTADRLCFVVVSSKTSCDRVTNLVKCYAMLRKTTEGSDCGRITLIFLLGPSCLEDEDEVTVVTQW